MEATGVDWTPILRILGDGEFELIVVNAAHFKNVPGRKTDMNDAMRLADLLSFGLVKASFVPTEQMHELRSLHGPASSWCASRRGMCSGSRRHSLKPISGSIR